MHQLINYSPLLDLDFVRPQLEHLTVARVTNHLHHIFNSGSFSIYYANKPTTPIELATTPPLAGVLAARIVIWFYGGPPGYKEWFEGTLLTLLIDHLFCSVALHQDTLTQKFLKALR